MLQPYLREREGERESDRIEKENGEEVSNQIKTIDVEESEI